MAPRAVVPAMGAADPRPAKLRAALRGVAALAVLTGAACIGSTSAFLGLTPRSLPLQRLRPAGSETLVRRRAFDFGQVFDSVFGDDDEDNVEVPGDVSAMVNQLKRSTENTLNAGISHMDVELPPAFRLGVEGEKKKSFLVEDVIKSTEKKEVVRGDRELARIFVEMLQPVADGLCVAFRTKSLAAGARKSWKLADEEGKIISFPEKAKGAFASEIGVPGKFKARLRDIGCKCLIVVSPQLEELQLIAEVREEFQDQIGIVLLNARIHGAGRRMIKIPARLKKDLRKNFQPSYHVRFLGERKNAMVYHMNGVEDKPWIVAIQRNALTGVVTRELIRSDKPPTQEEIEKAFAEYDKKEKTTEDKFLDMVDGENR